MRRIVAMVMVVSFLAGCVSIPRDRVVTGRVYNLSTGEVFQFVSHVNAAGKSIITAGPTTSGETFSGEAQSIQNAVQTSSYGSAVASNPGEPFSTFVSSSSYSVSRPGYQNGAAILVGNKGTVIDVVYQVSLSDTGEGEGKDNRNTHYRILF